MRKKKICYSPEEKEYIAAMDRLHFQPEDKMAIVNRVVSEAGNRVTPAFPAGGQDGNRESGCL